MIPLKDSQSTNIFPFWVIAIIIANVFIFYQQIMASNLELIINQFALIPNKIDFQNLPSLFPFISSQFLHGGFLHLLSNMWFLYIFGDNVEERAGVLFFPLLYLLSGAVGAYAQYIFMPDSSIPMLGASGAIAGVLGAYFAWFPHHTIKTIVPLFIIITILDVPAFVMLFYWLFTQFISGVGTLNPNQDIGGVAYFAHIAGFATGWLLAKITTPNQSTA